MPGYFAVTRAGTGTVVVADERGGKMKEVHNLLRKCSLHEHTQGHKGTKDG